MRFICPECGKEFDSARPTEQEQLKCPDCGHEFADPDATVVDDLGPPAAAGVTPGKELGGFRIEAKIGTGAMGEVYKATQLSLERTVALKVLPRVFAERPAFVKRFYDESMALSALNHPNVVTIIERGNVGNIYFFVMEYVDGHSVQEMMSEGFDIEQILRIARGTATALDYAHRQGVVHRDIKPSNIMLTNEFEVKIADFGLAGLIEQERKAMSEQRGQPRRMGTPAYMSPEQRRNPYEVDGRTDIWAAGVVLHELVTGKRPETPLRQTPSEFAETADPRLDPIIVRCLEGAAEDRYQTAADLLHELTQLEAELRRAPRCSACGKLSPVRDHSCVHCGESLEEFFDVCPECKHKNRREVRHCLQCGVDLEKGRTIVGDRISMMLDRADRLRLNGSFAEALQIADEVEAVEGKAFEDERQRARALRKQTLAERRKAAERTYQEGRRMVREHRFKEAVERFKSVPSDIRDTTGAVKAAMQLQARLAADKRSKATTNLIILAIGLLLVLVMLFFALRQAGFL